MAARDASSDHPCGRAGGFDGYGGPMPESPTGRAPRSMAAMLLEVVPGQQANADPQLQPANLGIPEDAADERDAGFRDRIVLEIVNGRHGRVGEVSKLFLASYLPLASFDQTAFARRKR